jgi:hypothetical protein
VNAVEGLYAAELVICTGAGRVVIRAERNAEVVGPFDGCPARRDVGEFSDPSALAVAISREEADVTTNEIAELRIPVELLFGDGES